MSSIFHLFKYNPNSIIILTFSRQNAFHFQCRKVTLYSALAHRQSLRHLLTGTCRSLFNEIECFLLTFSEFLLRHISVIVSDIGYVGGGKNDLLAKLGNNLQMDRKIGQFKIFFDDSREMGSILL